MTSGWTNIQKLSDRDAWHIQLRALAGSALRFGLATSALTLQVGLSQLQIRLQPPENQLQLYEGTSGIPWAHLGWRRLALPGPHRGWRLGQPLDHRAQECGPLLSCGGGQLLNSTCRGDRGGSGVQADAQQA